MKKLIILLAALALLATTILAHADALPEFEFDAAAGRITAYNGPGGEVALPGEIDGARVWDVQGPIFQNNESVTSLALPEGMDVMNDNLTSQVPNLASVTLPQSLRVSFLICMAFLQPVAPAPDGGERGALHACLFQLGPQPPHMGVYCAGIPRVVIAPEVVKQFVTGKDAPLVGQEQVQQIIFLAGLGEGCSRYQRCALFLEQSEIA